MTDTMATAEAGPATEVAVGGRGLRIIHNLGWAFIYLGVLTLGFVVHQLYITSWFAQQNQPVLAQERIEQWGDTEITEVAVVPTADDPDDSGIVSGATGGEADIVAPEPLILKVESPPDDGVAFALIRIPKLDRLAEGWNVVEGVGTQNLKNGAGHMPDTALPGQPGNAVISGHRTTYGEPFRELDALDPGDRIEVETALGTHVYIVRETRVVSPTDVWVAEPRDGAWLTLTTCHPLLSARQRFVVFAELNFGPNADVIEAMT
ncbi:MAG: class E sortase [bacterium]|nr:class E sortase [bacterium]MCP4966241.1 class E sortase [bacterium]